MTGTVWLDRCFVKMEKRQLQFLLKGKSQQLYREWLRKPDEYRQRIYNMEMSDEPAIKNR